MLILGTMAEMARQASQPVYPDDGEFGGWPLILMGAGSLILGGGGLWIMHEQHTEKDMYYQCMEKAIAEYSMSPAEAKILCSPGLEPKKTLFDLDLGLNAATIVIAVGSVFGLWYVTKLLATAMKS